MAAPAAANNDITPVAEDSNWYAATLIYLTPILECRVSVCASGKRAGRKKLFIRVFFSSKQKGEGEKKYLGN